MSHVNWTNVTNLNDILSIANNTSEGWFWTGMIWMIWIVMVLSLIGFGFENAVLSASFIALIGSVFLLYAGLVGTVWTAGVFIGLILLMMILKILQKE